ncbi:MAG: hypothetical protein ABN483_02925 [Pantoea agglomerans]|uniref:hypothetical protein n=1 Tax=Pantoea sp. EKM20T TaxID=2708059 RepID=UPI00142DBE1F|nr:hypothetical protein [Pantoea sp. EKM20T]KAF6684012.1 hypothetical protein HFD94_08205 [Pantoea sp. EKM20T]
MDRFNPPTNGEQLDLNLRAIREVEIDGIQMGVLSNGTPYLTMRGLAIMCGVAPSVIQGIAANWPAERLKPRGRKIDASLTAQGYNSDQLVIKTKGNGGEVHAYTDAVCMSILEYYALDASQPNSEVARNNYRILARDSFRRFIYQRTGYSEASTLASLQVFQQRLQLNDQIPANYFSIFREMADLTFHLANSNFKLDAQSIPDISVGIHWGKYWSKNSLADQYGERVKFPHNYPENFPQAQGNQKEAWIYPILSLGVFRSWLQSTYVHTHLAPYLTKKVGEGALPAPKAEQILIAVQRPALPGR